MAPGRREVAFVSGHLSLANGTRVPLRDGFVLGRVAGCDLVIDDSKASRRHAKFHVESGVVEIEDLQSSNGTLLNEKPVTRRVLRDGDRVQIGKTVLVFREAELPAEASATVLAAAPRPKPAPAAAPPPAAVAAAPAAFDDNDLFGESPATPSAPAPMAAPAPAPAPTPASPPPAAPPKAPAVVEFADEVVEVKKPAPPPAAAAAAARTAPSAAAGARTQPSAAAGHASGPPGSRVLQFQKKAGGGGLLGDDMGQMGGGARALLIVGVLALGAGIVWLVKGLVA